jgi:hypothetical protein
VPHSQLMPSGPSYGSAVSRRKPAESCPPNPNALARFADGKGWHRMGFLLNGRSFAAVLLSMSLFRFSELRAIVRAHRTTSGFLERFRYVGERPELRAILVMLFLTGTFGPNLPLFISTMCSDLLCMQKRTKTSLHRNADTQASTTIASLREPRRDNPESLPRRELIYAPFPAFEEIFANRFSESRELRGAKLSSARRRLRCFAPKPSM